MIPLIEEPKDLIEEFRVYEDCHFKCGSKTKFWHTKTNTPICEDCGKTHNVSDITKN